jgi:DNA-binding response OmpR family regulator
MNDSADSKCVLIIDDEKAIADSLAAIFKQQGFDAHAAYSAEQALDLVDRLQPALAILDVVLPRMNGIDLAILLKAEFPACEIVLISGQFVTETLVQQAARQGHDFYVYPKPFPPQALLAKARELLSREAPAQSFSSL